MSTGDDDLSRICAMSFLERLSSCLWVKKNVATADAAHCSILISVCFERPVLPPGTLPTTRNANPQGAPPARILF